MPKQAISQQGEAAAVRHPSGGGGRGLPGEPPYTRLLAHSMRNAFKATRCRAVLSGDVLELYEHEKPVFYDIMEPKERQMGKGSTEDELIENRKRARSRSKKMVERLVHANFGFWLDHEGRPYLSKMLTLTFGYEAHDIKEANRHFTRFIKRLNYALFRSKKAVVQYLAVIEFQPKSKRIHYHVILFNLPFIPRYYDVFSEAWGNGFILIKKINDEKGAARYITKYITKEDDDRLRGEKSYFCSRGLKKPISLKEEEAVYQLRSLLKSKPVYIGEYENEHTGHTKYYRFNVSGQEELKDFIHAYGHKSG